MSQRWLRKCLVAPRTRLSSLLDLRVTVWLPNKFCWEKSRQRSKARAQNSCLRNLSCSAYLDQSFMRVKYQVLPKVFKLLPWLANFLNFLYRLSDHNHSGRPSLVTKFAFSPSKWKIFHRHFIVCTFILQIAISRQFSLQFLFKFLVPLRVFVDDVEKLNTLFAPLADSSSVQFPTLWLVSRAFLWFSWKSATWSKNENKIATLSDKLYTRKVLQTTRSRLVV